MFRWFKNICKTYVSFIIVLVPYVCHPALCLNSSRLCRSFSSSSSGISAIHVRDSQPCSSSNSLWQCGCICFWEEQGCCPPLSLINLRCLHHALSLYLVALVVSSEVRMSLWVLAPQPLDSLEHLCNNNNNNKQQQQQLQQQPQQQLQQKPQQQQQTSENSRSDF